MIPKRRHFYFDLSLYFEMLYQYWNNPRNWIIKRLAIGIYLNIKILFLWVFCNREWKNLKKQVCPETKMQKVSRGNVKGTSVARTLHVKSSLIRHKIFRSCFLCTIVQFTDVLTNDDIVTLTRDFFFTPEITFSRQQIAIHFKHVTF